MTPRFFLGLLVLAALAIPATPAAGATVIMDGALDATYGPPLSVQTTQADVWGSSNLGLIDFANGSELDLAFGIVADGALHLFFAGNLMAYLNPVEAGTIHDALVLFVDSKPGGQNQLRADNPNVGLGYLRAMAGLTFDLGFDPDYSLSFNGYGGPGYAPYILVASSVETPTGGGGAGYYLGQGLAGGPGTLTGGTNPYGVLVTINNSNTAGVGTGCAAASGSGVTTGIEWSIPLAAIGNPTGCIKVCALVTNGSYDHLPNQVLGPLPPGTCHPGAVWTVNFASIPGSQYFTVCSAPVPAPTSSWGALKTIYR